MSWVNRLLGRTPPPPAPREPSDDADRRLDAAYVAVARDVDPAIAAEWNRELRKVDEACASKESDKPPPQITIRPVSGIDWEDYLP